jgi:hypothetical protein
MMRNAGRLNVGKLRELAKKYRIGGEFGRIEKELEMLRNVADYYQKGR